MDAYNLSDHDDRLAALVDRAAAGEDVEIVRDGQVVAHLTAPGSPPAATSETLRDVRRKASIERLRAMTAGMPMDPIDSVAEMRKQARY